MKNIIEVKNLTKEFKTKMRKPGLKGVIKNLFKPDYKIIRAVDNLNLDVKKGEMLAFIGPNGAGKSTTIKMMTGILYPTSGEARIKGLIPWKNRKKISYYIGSVFGQKSQLWYHLPPMDTFNLFSKIYDLEEKEYKKRINYLIKEFEIKPFMNQTVRNMSLGQRMRCELIASLIHEPEVIFLDEPSIGLDVVAKQNLRGLIKKINEEEEVTIFLTSHDVADIEDLCKRIVIIDNGRVIYDHNVNHLKRKYIKKKDIILDYKGKKPELGRVELVEETDTNRLRIRIDLTKTSTASVIKNALETTEVKDITIKEPSVENIISKIYQRG